MSTPPTSTSRADAVPLLPARAVLGLVATALGRMSGPGLPAGRAYPDEAQKALNHVVLASLCHGQEPPRGVPDLVWWAAHRPLDLWPLAFDEQVGAEIAGQCLLDPDAWVPTQLCLELSNSAADPEAEAVENEHMRRVLERCRNSGASQMYVAFRRLLIEHPVLDEEQFADVRADRVLDPILEQIDQLYVPAPVHYSRGGDYAVCQGCGCLLAPAPHGAWVCELDRCRNRGRAVVDRLLPAEQRVRVLQRPMRMFITGPGLAEIDLERELSTLEHVAIEMWPGVDAYDLGVRFPDDTVWAIDVKDRASPTQLARSAAMPRRDPPYQRAFLVVPDYRLEQTPTYVEDYDRALPDELQGLLPLYTATAIVEATKRELQSQKGAADA